MKPPLPPLPQRIGVDPVQLRNQVEIFKVDVQLHEREIFTFQEFRKQERTMWRALAGGNGIPSAAVEQFSLSHKAYEAAIVEIKRLELAKLKSQLAISEAMLAEAERVMEQDKKILC